MFFLFFQELKEEIPKEHSEMERLTALHQQRQQEQQQASSDNRRKQQLVADAGQRARMAADQQRIR